MLFSSGTFDHVVPNHPEPDLPLRLSLAPDAGRTLARCLLIGPALLALLIPALLAAALIANRDLASQAQAGGHELLALAALPVLWIAALALAAAAILPRLARRRVAMVSAEQVSVLETHLTGTDAWRIPTACYRGIAHHVRATTGTVMHEVILVHADPARSILLHTAPVVAQACLDHFSRGLRLPIVPSEAVYSLGLPHWSLRRLGAGQGAASHLLPSTAGGHGGRAA